VNGQDDVTRLRAAVPVVKRLLPEIGLIQTLIRHVSTTMPKFGILKNLGDFNVS
jgi:hypothetical protein